MCDEYITYYVGEKDEIEGYVQPKTAGETVVITSARYEITKEYSDEIVAEGSCNIDGNHFSAMLSFSQPGNYIFAAYLKVGDAEPVETAHITVKKARG